MLCCVCPAHRCSHLSPLTHWAVDARVLVVAEEEAVLAATLVAAHGVDTRVLAATVVELALVHIYSTEDWSHGFSSVCTNHPFCPVFTNTANSIPNIKILEHKYLWVFQIAGRAKPKLFVLELWRRKESGGWGGGGVRSSPTSSPHTHDSSGHHPAYWLTGLWPLLPRQLCPSCAKLNPSWQVQR